jgi:hypothetical protein
MWGRRDSNPQPSDYESPALTVELQPLWSGKSTFFQRVVDSNRSSVSGAFKSRQYYARILVNGKES